MRLMKHRIRFVIYMVGLGFFILTFRGISLQLFPHKKLSQLKERLFETSIKVTPRRGVIYDRYGKELAISTPSQSLFADPHKIKEPYFMAKKLSSLLKVPRKPLLKKLLRKKRRFAWVKRHLTKKEVQKVKALKLEGLHFLKESKRFYTRGKSLSQVLGFTNIDGHGLEGIEKKYDNILQGEEQRVLVKRDARGRPLFSTFTPFIDKVSGFNIYLTIDSDLQFYFEKELNKAVAMSQAESAMGVVLSVDHSEVLAMINIPNYDPNNIHNVKNKNHKRNRVVTDLFEPGSTLKTFTVVSAIQSGVSPSKKYSTHNGKLKVEGEIIREADSKKKFDPHLNMSEILSVSSNVGAALIALDIGSKKLRDTLFKFGFGQKTGLDFIGEAKGVLRNLPWRPIETATVSFGHGVSSTALQVANAYTAIGNGGFLKEPQLIKRISSPYNGEEKLFSEKVIRQVLTEDEAQMIIFMLTSVTEETGTGFQAIVPGYLTAGKTGTAQKVDFEKGGYKDSEYVSSFIGFIPAHKPKYVVYVVIDGPKNNFYASTLAAPVFSKVASYAVRKQGLSPTLFEEKNLLLVDSKKENKKIIRELASIHQMPELKGLTLREVLKKFNKQNIKFNIKGQGRVIQTLPLSGQSIPPNKRITLVLK